MFGWFRRQKPKVEAAAHIQGPGSYEFDVVGESYYQDALERICGGRTKSGVEKKVVAMLVLEDSNPHDKLAVRVDVDGKPVGYLSRDEARQYRKRLQEQGFPELIATCNALIVGGWDRGGGDRGHFGVRLDLPAG